MDLTCDEDSLSRRTDTQNAPLAGQQLHKARRLGTAAFHSLLNKGQPRVVVV